MAKNTTELRNELLKIFEDLRRGDIEPAEAKELNNTAGKIIGTVKVQLEYSALRKEKPEIPFIG